MKICVIGKYPPIQGGTSAQTFWFCRLFAERGHHVHVVTNAGEVEPEYRAWLLPGDEKQLRGVTPAGGELTLTVTQPWDSRRFRYIPAGTAAASRLAAMATEVVRERRCDLVFGWYLEPYGIAANLAAAWTGVPYVVRYAGSDRSCLMAHAEAGLAYKEVMRGAAGVLTEGEDLSGFGIPPDRAVRAPGRYLPGAFAPQTRPADLTALLSALRADGCPAVRNPRRLDPDLPVIGVYGKAGPTKGTLCLLRAMTRLRERRVPVQLVIMGGGVAWPRMLAAVSHAGLDDAVWTLPFLAPWRVPGFIRACTAVCFLEHGFEVTQHTPAVAAEVMASGTALIVSREVAEKQPYAGHLVDRANHFLVADPTDDAALAGVIAAVAGHPARARAAGARGAELVRSAEPGHAEGYERAFGTCLGRTAPRRVPSRPGAPRPRVSRPEVESLLRARCPVTVRLLGQRLSAAAETACERYPDPGAALLAAYAVTRDLVTGAAFAQAAAELRQLATVEHHLLWFGTDAEGIEGRPAFGVPVVSAPDLRAMDGATVRALHPVTSRQVRVERFGIDVSGHLARTAAGTIADTTGQTLLFRKRPDLAGTVYRIGDGTRRVLAHCDGAVSLAGIAAVTGTGPRGWPGLVRLVEFLHAEGIVAFARYPLAGARRPALASPGTAP